MSSPRDETRAGLLGKRRERGAALLLAILVAAIAVPVAIEAAFVSRIEGAVSNRAVLAANARILGRSAVEVARAVLADDPDWIDHPGEAWARIEPLEVEGWRVEIRIEDEGRRFPVNTVVRADGTLSIGRKAALAMVLRAAGLGAAASDVVVDWIDPDVEPLPNGAEDAAYAALRPPRRPPHGPILSPAEFGRLAGFDAAAAARAGEVLTPWGGRVNVNTASPEVLAAFGFERALAERLAASIQARPVATWDEFVARAGLPEEFASAARPLFAVSSTHFRVRVRVEREGYAPPFELETVLDRSAGLRAVFWRES